MSCYYRYNGGWNSWQSRGYVDNDARRALEPDQDQKNIFKEIGNVNINIDNQNILIAVLVVVAVLTGTLDSAGIQGLLARFVSPSN